MWIVDTTLIDLVEMAIDEFTDIVPVDLVVRIGDSAVTGLDDFDSALRKYKGGDTVTVVVERDGAEVSLPVTLGDPR